VASESIRWRNLFFWGCCFSQREPIIDFANPEAKRWKAYGASRDRTGDLVVANHALFQLSYGPVP
jgi:hypothetical protein